MTALPIHIGLFGTFDCKNYGDLLFPDVFRNEIKKRLPGVRVTLFSPLGGIKPFTEGDVVFPIRDLGRIHSESPFSAFVIGGGDLIRLDDSFVADSAKYPGAGRTSQTWLIPILFGRLRGVPVFFNAPGVPFPFSEKCRPLVSSLLSVVHNPNVRDETSRAMLSFSEPEVSIDVVPDTVCLYDETIGSGTAEDVFSSVAEREKIPERYALFQCSGLEPGLTEADCSECILELSQWSDCSVVLLPIGYVHSDVEILHRIAEASGGRLSVIGSDLSPLEMFSVIGHATWFAGTSMHGCLTAMQQGVPTIAIRYGSVAKIDGLMASYGMSENVVPGFSAIRPEMFSRKASPSSRESLRARARSHFDRLAAALRSLPSDDFSSRDESLVSRLSSFVCDVPSPPDTGLVYFDCGGGFSEENMRRIRLRSDGDCILLEERIPVPSGCTRLRFDPMEGWFIRILEASFHADGQSELVPVISGGFSLNGQTVFPSLDPQFVLIVPDGCEEVSVRVKFVRVFGADIPPIVGLLQSEFENVSRIAAELRREDVELKRENVELRRENVEWRRENVELRRENVELKNSLSWKVTAPLRYVFDLFSRKAQK